MEGRSGAILAAVGVVLVATAGGVIVLADGSPVPGMAGTSNETATPGESGGEPRATSPTGTPSPTATQGSADVAEPTPTETPSSSASTPTPTASPTWTETPSGDVTPTPSTRTATASPTPTPTPTPTPAPSSDTSSNHTVNATVPDQVNGTDERYQAVEIDYGDASGENESIVVTKVRAGVDHRDEHYRDEYGGGDEPGAGVDENLTVTNVSAEDGVMRVTFDGRVDLRPEDELVVFVTGSSPAADTVEVTIEGTDVVIQTTGTVTREDERGGNESTTPTPTPTDDGGW